MTRWYDNIPAPLDANGREVPLDTRELVYRGETRYVYNIAFIPTGNVWSASLAGVTNRARLSACTLPDSWERLEEDAGKDACEYFNQTCSASCSACPAKSDETDPRICFNVIARDLVRRAKALAGVSDGE